MILQNEKALHCSEFFLKIPKNVSRYHLQIQRVDFFSFSIASLFRALHFPTVSCFKIYLFSLRESITSSCKMVFSGKKEFFALTDFKCLHSSFCNPLLWQTDINCIHTSFSQKNFWFFSSMDVLLNMERVLYTPLIFRHHIDCIIRIYTNVCFLFLS